MMFDQAKGMYNDLYTLTKSPFISSLQTSRIGKRHGLT